MNVVRKIADLPVHRAGIVGLVPTMGAFHEGHLSLMRAARSACDTVFVSLFVNPTQFGPNEDYTRYPRDEERDFAMAAETGVDYIFAPTAEEMYPHLCTAVKVEGVTDLWEGAHRPGHFDGVATVVCKLFNLVAPDLAYFGLKDYQQCAVIQAMVRDLNMRVRLEFCETVREPSGLALSSRNRYLPDHARESAAVLYGELKRIAQALRDTHAEAIAVSKRIAEGIDSLGHAGFSVDYLALVDAETLAPVATLGAEARLLVAARLGAVRLIDNIAV